jgi:AraC-like DNA-binding protein
MDPGSNTRSSNGTRNGLSQIMRRPANSGNAAMIRRGPEGVDRALGWQKSDQYRLLQPQISTDGIHLWPFNSAVPIDLRILTSDGHNTVQKNRHDYFEILVLCSGTSTFLVEDRLLPMHKGDLAVVGSTLYHSTECPVNSKAMLGVLYFDPNLIGSDGSAYSTEYLAPFLQQDSKFPHVLSARTGVPGQVLDLMRMIHTELPGSSMRGRLAIKTYLKMILLLLVNRYSSYAGIREIFCRQQHALGRIHKFFELLPGHIGDVIHVADAARWCGLTEPEFICFLRQVTGRSFRTYLNHYRVERAQVALASTSRAISDIAQELGFCDQSYFSAVFYKFAGMTPLTYRRRHNGTGVSPG